MEGLGLNERTFQYQVEQACTWHGLAAYHTYDSRRSEPGFPDLVVVGHGGVLFRELKTDSGRLSPHQRYWLDALTEAGQDADVWRPADFESRVLPELRALGRLRVQKPAKPVTKVRRSSRPTR